MSWDWDEGEKTRTGFGRPQDSDYIFLIFGHLIKKEFGFTWHLNKKKGD